MGEQVFVARERELSRLQTFLSLALAKKGQVCLISGVAGSGKTALVTEFVRRAQVEHKDLVVAIGNCNSHTGIGDPYLPFREILVLLTGDTETKLAQGVISTENARRLGNLLVHSGQVLIEIAPDLIDTFVPGVKLAALLGKTVVQKFGWMEDLENLLKRKAEHSSMGEPAILQSRILEQYVNVLRVLSAQKPLMLVLDDLHWSDAASVGLLFHLSRRIGDSRILLVGTYRTDEVAVGRAGERHPLVPVINEVKRSYGDVVIDLGTSAEADGRHFVSALLETEPNALSDEFREALFQHTEGHALFTVELLRQMQMQGDLVQDAKGRWVEGPKLNWETLPARVEGVIAERIGRLEEELREALTVASVEGEDFTAEVIARVQAANERDLIRRLSAEADKQHHLIDAGDVRQLGLQRLCSYKFRHNLFQRYLYNSLAEGERAYLHEDVGKILEILYKDRMDEISIQLAWHFEEAGLLEKAVTYLLQTANRALQLSANQEAIDHLRRALSLVHQLPETPERVQQELKVQLALGVGLTATKGYSAPDVAEVFRRARELCQQIGDTLQIFPVLTGLCRFHIVRGEHAISHEFANQTLRLAEGVNDPALLVEAYWLCGAAHFWRGELATAREYLEKGLALYSSEKYGRHALLYGQDPGVVTLSYLGWALGILGYPTQSVERLQQAITLAESVSHPFSVGFGLHCASIVHALLRDDEQVLEHTKREIELSLKYGFPLWRTGGTTIRGWALAEHGKEDEGIALIREGFAGWLDTGAGLARTYYLGLLADACRMAQQVDAGLAAVTEALAAGEMTGESFYLAEVTRLKGELWLIQSANSSGAQTIAEVEAAFLEALTLAQQQGAKTFELRATMSLVRLYRANNNSSRLAEVQKMLEETIHWFAAETETVDLQEAKALLAQVA